MPDFASVAAGALAGLFGGIDKQRQYEAAQAQQKAEDDLRQQQVMASLFGQGFRPPAPSSAAIQLPSMGGAAPSLSIGARGIQGFQDAQPTVKVGGQALQLDPAQTPEARQVRHQMAGVKLEAQKKTQQDADENRAAWETLNGFSGVLGVPVGPFDPRKDYKMASHLATAKVGRDAAQLNASASRDQRQGNQAMEREFKLRDEFSSQKPVKDAVEVGLHFQRVNAAAKDPSAAGDLAMIYGFMKMLDPGSTVREGEFANAQNAGGIPAKIQAAYNKAINGERLSEQQRADFLRQAASQAAATKVKVAQVRRRYDEYAKRYGIDPAVITYDPFEQPTDDVGGAAGKPANPFR